MVIRMVACSEEGNGGREIILGKSVIGVFSIREQAPGALGLVPLRGWGFSSISSNKQQLCFCTTHGGRSATEWKEAGVGYMPVVFVGRGNNILLIFLEERL